jgi:hypothetical protein
VQQEQEQVKLEMSDVNYDSEGRICFEGSMKLGFSSHKLDVPDDEQLQLWRSNALLLFKSFPHN